MGRKKTTEEFVVQAREVHGDRYGYDKAVYTGAMKKITITCPVHGDFEQKVDNHINGCGCRKCMGDNLRSDTEIFIKRAIAMHGDKYRYDKVCYTHSKKKITITCPVHGDFEQEANSHLRGANCPKCRYYNTSKAMSSDTKTFVKRAIAMHGGRYTYVKVVYLSARQKVTITCPVHGDFEQSPTVHIKGCGCPKCGDEGSSKDRRSDTKTFVKRALDVHGNNYNYVKVVYLSARQKVTITCPVHGDFEQSPTGHLSGKGCSKCQKQWSGDGVVYVMCTPEGYNKIGIAKSGTEHNRLNQILRSQQTKAPTSFTDLNLVCAYSFNDGSFTEARRFEGKSHRNFKTRRKVFPDKFEGSSEFFTVPVSEICSYLEQQGGRLVTIKQ